MSMTSKEVQSYNKCPKCGAEYNERRDWCYDYGDGKHWFFDYYTCAVCGQDYTEMYAYAATYYEEEA